MEITCLRQRYAPLWHVLQKCGFYAGTENGWHEERIVQSNSDKASVLWTCHERQGTGKEKKDGLNEWEKSKGKQKTKYLDGALQRMKKYEVEREVELVSLTFKYRSLANPGIAIVCEDIAPKETIACYINYKSIHKSRQSF